MYDFLPLRLLSRGAFGLVQVVQIQDLAQNRIVSLRQNLRKKDYMSLDKYEPRNLARHSTCFLDLCLRFVSIFVLVAVPYPDCDGARIPRCATPDVANSRGLDGHCLRGAVTW